MKLDQFIAAIDSLVWKWAPEHDDSITPRAELERIYNEIRETTVHAVAEAMPKGKTLVQLAEEGKL